jgi:hypothetical protein
VELSRLVGSYQAVQALHVAAALGIADLLADGARSSDDLAEATGAHADSLYRVLRALATVGVLEEQPGRSFALTELGEGLREDAIRTRLLFIGRPHHWNTWAALLHSVRTGENAFASLYGQTVWEYRTEHPEESAVFDDFMVAQTRLFDEAIVAGYDFGRFAHVVDVGGGRGAFLAAILAANPGTRGTLFDQEHVVAAADVGHRCDIVAGSFFDQVPPGADAYVLKSVIHDWRDPEAESILRTCAAALEGDARVLLVERDLGDPVAAWLDLQMLVMAGGRERTEAEYAALFRAAGLDYAGMAPVGSGWAVFEGRAA